MIANLVTSQCNVSSDTTCCVKFRYSKDLNKPLMGKICHLWYVQIHGGCCLPSGNVTLPCYTRFSNLHDAHRNYPLCLP